MELARSNLTAAASPTSFWDYAVEHAVDVLNRTSGPPGPRPISSYESLTGARPAIMSVMPFGCRAYAVKPRVAISKTKLEPRALVGVHLCRTAGMPGAYSIW
eukprot:1517596-Pleurochrysis_carterae.AAC.1